MCNKHSNLILPRGFRCLSVTGSSCFFFNLITYNPAYATRGLVTMMLRKKVVVFFNQPLTGYTIGQSVVPRDSQLHHRMDG